MINNDQSREKELTILENIYRQPGDVRQRDLAEIAGLSLGMTNAILKRLALKGLLTIKKVNNRNIHYLVTPSGIEAITKKSYRYFKHTIKNVVFYREAIEKLVDNIIAQGFEGLVLKGTSDLDFIVEHACGKAGLKYIKDDKTNGKIFVLYSEKYPPQLQMEGISYLNSILIPGTAGNKIDNKSGSA